MVSLSNDIRVKVNGILDVSQLSSSSTPVLLGPSLANGKPLVLFARPFQGGGGVDDRVALRKGRRTPHFFPTRSSRHSSSHPPLSSSSSYLVRIRILRLGYSSPSQAVSPSFQAQGNEDQGPETRTWTTLCRGRQDYSTTTNGRS